MVMVMSVSEAKNMVIKVEVHFVEEQSSVRYGHYVWSYRVTILNNNPDTIQLITRYWNIIDSYARQQEIEGVGVVGQQPILCMGQSFSYRSGVSLSTPCGFMQGRYLMRTGEKQFLVDILPFSLDSPFANMILH